MNSYEKLLAAKALEDHGVSPRALDTWLDRDRLIVDKVLQECMATCMEVFNPREDRQLPLMFIGGNTGTGKTVAAAVGLGEAVAEGFRRQRQGTLDMRQARSHLQREEPITPERVRRVLGLDWETYQANERIQPGVCAAQVRAAYVSEGTWDFETCPVSFAFWEATERARRQHFGKQAEAELEHARTCDILIMDDMGAELVTDRSPWLSIVDELVNARYAASLVTVLTTNRGIADFCQRYRARVVDRFRECGRVRELAGHSRRQSGGGR
jgi:hypothetical protein